MKARSLLAILAVICASNASLAQTPATGAQPVAAAPSAAQYLSVLDATFYLNKYPDLKAAFGTNLDAAKTHWLQYGIKEGRDSAAGFSIGGYMARYPELQKTFGIDYAAYLGHWFSNGIKEKRDPSATGTFMGDPRAAPLDPIFYARKYPELMAAFGFNVPGLVNHWLQYGINEKRQPNATAPAPAGVPGAPTIGTATPGNATASVTFTAPASNGGSAITGYTVTSIPGGLTVTGAASPLTVTGLTNGTAYIFNATARNAVGTSPASAASNIATPAVPVAAQAALTLPIGYQAVRLDTQANFTADLPVGTQFIIQSGVGYWSVRLGAAGAWSQPALVTNLANATLFTSCFVGAFNTSDYAYTRPAGYTGTFVQVMPCTGPSTAPTGGMIFDANAAPQYLSIGDWNNRGMNRVFTFTADNAVGDDWGNWLGDMFQPKVTFANAMRTRMIKPPAAAPGAPTTVTASPANAQATVSFIAPASNGGSALSYTVTSSPGGLIAKGAASPLTVTGLTNGTAYTFTVTASNAAGTSAASAASSSVTPVGAPGAPTIGTATPGNATASVGFSAPVSNGGSAITGYTVTSNPAGGVDANVGTTGLTHSITGLTNGTAYTFTVTASSAAGTSAVSAASSSVTPAGVPGAPTIGTATPGATTASVSFTAPVSNGGSAITGYTVTSNPAGGVDANVGTTGLTHSITGLTNGTAYTFTVTASNAAGTSAASAASSSVTPAGVPGAPTIGTATPGNATASVGFSAPVSNGGSAITGYTVTSNPAGGVDANAKTTGLTHSITGLTNGTAYTFTVTASSAAGTSAASVASNSATPATVPTAPTIGTVMQGTTAAIVTFTAPVSNGGSAITGYTVTSNPAGGVDFNANTTDLTHNITGLTKGTAYTFTVKAVNAIGTSAASAAPNSAPPGGVPGVPYMRGATLADTTAATATVSFTAPDNNGGSAITGYTVKSSPGGLTATGAASPLTVTGLTYGTTYTFTVTASNAAGTSAASVESNSATPATVLTIPAGYQAIRLDTQANFTADLPAGTQFIILSRSDDVPGVAIWYWKFSLGGPGPELVSNPAEATLFTNCLVSGFNTSDSTSTRPAGYTGTFVQVMPCTGPSGAPTGGMIFVGTGAPAYAGFANWNTAGKFRVFTFTANSAVGDNSGNWLGKGFVGKVPFANAMPTRMIKPTPAAPGAPTTVTASAGNAQATLSFDAPANTGGIAIKGYTVTSSPGALTATGAASPLTVTGLTNGTAYTFTITASNAVGTSAASAASNSATPVDPKIAAAAKIAADAAKAAADKATAAVKVATDALVAAKTATDSCAVLVNKVTSSPAPAGFAASVTDDLSNSIFAVQYRAAHPAKIAGGKPDDIDSKLLKPIPADHLAYIVKLKAASAEMETGCQAAAAYKGDALVKQVLADVKAAKFDAPGDTAANNKSRADAVAKGLTDYLVSSTALADAMTKLSTDRMHQAYTGTWVKQFLERN